jgi:hypothetical protein
MELSQQDGCHVLSGLSVDNHEINPAARENSAERWGGFCATYFYRYEQLRHIKAGLLGCIITGCMDNFALLRALASEERARNASDPAVKKEWEVLAIEWHRLATMAAKAAAKVPRAKCG